ncbi:MAG: glycerophosphodiester phosphodiesterase [Deltaproteobacteria bacterium]|nr:glycerophosphodiester phosphodiesterase [Deltaproteobacteria bacterium]
MSKNTPQVKAERLTQKLYVIGHRGAAGLAPENTLAAFNKAIEIGVDAIELDVHLTVEKKLVVYHDYCLKPEITRTSKGIWVNASKPIKDLTIAELKIYDVGRLKPGTSYSKRYPEQQSVDGSRIPTLHEVISLLQHKSGNTKLWIEIKTSPEKPDLSRGPEVVAEAVVRLLREENFSTRAFILSFDWRALVHVQKIAPKIPTLHLSVPSRRPDNIKPGKPGSSPWTTGLDLDDFDSVPGAVKAAGGKYWGPQSKKLTSKLVQEAHQLGIRVFTWTPDVKSDMKRLIKMNVDGIITNRPDILIAVLGESAASKGSTGSTT